MWKSGAARMQRRKERGAPMSISHDRPVADYRPSKLPSSARYGRSRTIPEDFDDIVADHRSCGRTDDDIALSFGITVEALHRRFYRSATFHVNRNGVAARGIPVGRRWRDIEDGAVGNTFSRDDARLVSGPAHTSGRLPGQQRAAS